MNKKHALLIGVNKYPQVEYQLRGCVNDTLLMKSILVNQFNFDQENIQELHDEAAHSEAIYSAMDRLSEVVQNDHVVVFHFSGHGRQRNTTRAEEGSGVSSTIMPCDSGTAPYPNCDISDDYIHKWLCILSEKTRFITLIFDSCHSGTMTRDADGSTLRGLPPDNRTSEELGINTSMSSIPPAAQRTGPGGWLALSDSYVVISGCADDERSREFDVDMGGTFERHGALTHYLAQALKTAQSGSTYRDVFELAQGKVSKRFSTQHPQIEGVQDREVFGVREIKPMRFIPVAAVDGSTVTLKGGAAHGLQVGSAWTVYAQGTKQADGSEALGEIKILRVGPLTSEGLVSKSTGEITAGARCVEKLPFAGQRPLQVDVSPLPDSDRALLGAGIEGSHLLTIAAKPEAADVRALIIEPRQQTSTSNPLPGIEQVETGSWALTNVTSTLPFPSLAASERGVIDKLIHNLETAARYRNVLQMDNPESGLDVEFSLIRESASGEQEVADGGDVAFKQGDMLTFKISNRQTTPVWVSVLHFGQNGQIEVVFPPRRASEKIRAGGSLEIDPIEPNHDGRQGTETLKAFFTSQPADFRWLQQTAVRAAVTPDVDLRQSDESADGALAARGDVAQDMPEEAWQAIKRSFVLTA